MKRRNKITKVIVLSLFIVLCLFIHSLTFSGFAMNSFSEAENKTTGVASRIYYFNVV